MRALRRGFDESSEGEPGYRTAEHEQPRIAARERARVVDEVIDAALAQTCRKISDGAGEPLRQSRERGLVLAELRAGALDGLRDLLDAVRGRALALLERLPAVLFEPLGETVGRSRSGSGIGFHRGAPLDHLGSRAEPGREFR